ncbi:ribose 5-phosphate isomerase B [Oceanivirga miroungae]|uniref:RpiB/LacA/LacB family sugar-phosphate isomerase n=1 Tax=Oceanivirga miroungae TaxID=1130046 RepID=A0A6I8MEQ0_9FUSO|nr:ribose 5-phosphate isomerase B [Oceanivirga miroungae]VWL85574.1 RpiB/LacA/LacB family sugar-phosphate isomerase [Oceanivirga miroungae]
MRVAIGNDHSGVEYKNELVKYMKELGVEVVNFGTDTLDSVDYPDYAKMVCNAILNKEVDYGVLICGTGIGISITANKIPGIRAALCYNEYMGSITRAHNDSNVIAFGARVLGIEVAKSTLKAFLETEFEGGRHQRRVDKMECGC